jgi:hypothetical protein
MGRPPAAIRCSERTGADPAGALSAPSDHGHDIELGYP